MKRMDWGWRMAVATLLAGAAATGSSSRAQAFNPQPEPPGRWGLFGIVAEQTARVSVVNTSPDPGGHAPGSCRVSLAFVDSEGIVLKETRLTLRPGQATSLDYGFQEPPEPGRDDAVGATAGRADRQGRARANRDREPRRSGGWEPRFLPLGPCVPTVEVFETATGRTAFMVAEARMGWTNNHNKTLVRDAGE